MKLSDITKEDLIEALKIADEHSRKMEEWTHNFINENIVDIDAFIKESPERALLLQCMGMDIFIEVFIKWRGKGDIKILPENIIKEEV